MGNMTKDDRIYSSYAGEQRGYFVCDVDHMECVVRWDNGRREVVFKSAIAKWPEGYE
jgi:hypothetical protein